MRKTVIIILSLVFFLTGTILSFFFVKNREKPKIKPLPLLKYTFENLKSTKFRESKIIFGEKLDETNDYISQMFYFEVPEKPDSLNFLKVSGLANIPKGEENYPVIVMFRGYMPKETYKSGAGTQPSAKVLAKNGFITLAPDFLGYGESASASATLFEDRFQTYTTALTLLNSLSSLKTIGADITKIGIWGHSNGGQIALSTIAISGVNYPTVLWAPVSKPFPYSILFYTDETDDYGKALRYALSIFEKDYDTELFSPANYYNWIKAPIQIHQGTADEEVLPFWTDELVDTLKKDNIDVTYFKYPGADHNLQPSGWNNAVLREIEFFKEEL
ncbi:MAG: prolyl oligopeptidase family serine peptidase [Candidatus Woesebacteria bacterium]|nr:prolyl oligopeptidase family serine peptidase [Candidatus Woesebacteria bacterium]